MGLFDAVVSAVAGAAEQGSLLQVVGGMLSNDGGQGGLTGLVEKFGQAGLGEIVQSWVGHGENMPVNAEQIEQVLGSGALSGIAQKLGVDPGQAAQQLAAVLPGLVDKLTPGGQAPEGGLGAGADLLGTLAGLLKS
jgi:uncharacterized protein YidB (DUF937 family)